MSLALSKTGDILYTPSGKRLSPLALGASSIAHLPVRQFQFIQDKLEHVLVRVVPLHNLDKEAQDELKTSVAGAFAPVLGGDVSIEVVIADRIEPTAAGKHRFIISIKPVTMKRDKIPQYEFDVITGGRTLRMAGNLHLLPGG